VHQFREHVDRSAGIGQRGANDRSAAVAAARTIRDFSFSPTPLALKAGQTVSITNHDSTDQSATDSGGAFDTGHIAPGTTGTVTITTPGAYDFHCNIHPTMTGEIDVSA
jgi:plastocyanin